MKTVLMLVAAGVAASAASAQPPVVVTADTPPTIRVSYADLNLGSPRGQQRLRDRVSAAARELCIDGSKGPLVLEMAERRCYEGSVRDAGDQMAQAIATQSTELASIAAVTGTIRR